MVRENNSNVRNLVISLVGIFVLIVVAICTSYAAFTFSKTGDKVNTITTGSITFSYNETSNGISIVNAQPMTDAAGKTLIAQSSENGINQGYFDFNVSGTIRGNKTISYEVYGLMDSASTLEPQYVKVYLTDGELTDAPLAGYDGAVVPVYNSLPVATSDSNGKRLYLGTFNNTDSVKNFRLRMWVADTYQGDKQTTIDPDTGITSSGTVKKNFSMTVNVKGA